jgi:hypothetical protein
VGGLEIEQSQLVNLKKQFFENQKFGDGVGDQTQASPSPSEQRKTTMLTF